MIVSKTSTMAVHLRIPITVEVVSGAELHSFYTDHPQLIDEIIDLVTQKVKDHVKEKTLAQIQEERHK